MFTHACMLAMTLHCCTLIPRLHYPKKECQHGTARHGTACFVSVNACFAVPCRAESCRADPLYKSELTRHGTTRHRFFWQCKRKRAKVGRAGVKKNLHLGTSSIVLCPESNVSKLERCEDIQACGNLMRNVRIMAESFVCAGFFLTSVMDYGGRNRKQGS